MNVTLRTSDREPDSCSADIVIVPSQDDLVIRGEVVYRVAKVVHTLGDRDIGSRIDVIVDPLAIEAEAVLP